MTFRLLRLVICVAIVGGCAASSFAVVLFSDGFNTNTSGNWTINKAPTATDPNKQKADFAFDYSTFGIPPAPGTSDTLGLRLRGNVPVDGSGNDVTSRPAGTTSGLSLSPTGKNFGTNYTMTFYAWSNFFGGANAQGLADVTNSEGGTANVLFALGTSGTVPLVVGNTGTVTNSTIDGIAFATTGDGGITNDYRAYPKTNAIGPTSLLAANTYDNTNAFYTAKFPAVAAPVAQQGLATAEYDEGTGFNPMAGTSQAGSFGFAWHKVEITKNNNSVTWEVNDNLFATVDTSALIMGGNNIALGVSDVNTSTARHPSLVFTVFDNLEVSDIVVPQPGDFNINGKVDTADYVIWREHFGEPNEDALNGNGDGLNGVDQGDYNLWKENFGNPPASGATSGIAIPEPSSLHLLVLAAACNCWRARRRSS